MCRTNQASSSRYPRGERGGFTLIELLVVISIIALLIALLLPTIKRSRHVVRTTICASNFRQLVMGANEYHSDNRGELPFYCTWGGWMFQSTDKYWAGSFWGIRYCNLGLLWSEEYVRDLKVYNCPARTVKDGYERFDERGINQIWNRDVYSTHYGLFYASNAVHSPVDYSSTPISIRLDGVGWTSSRGGGRTENRALISDWARYDIGNNDLEGFGHVPLGLNIAYVDGSVRFKRDPDLVAIAPNTVDYSVSMFWDSGYLEE